ncbi:MAG TPA: ZIP family metal transporter, partial [Burkholderiales bacterium]
MTTAVLAARKLLQQREHHALLLVLAAVGLVIFGASLSRAVAHAPALDAALLATAFTALATGVGALPVLFVGRASRRSQSVMLGFSAGIMLAAAAFSLALPALQISTIAVVAGGIVIGAGVMLLIDRSLPHAHTADGAARRPGNMARIWLVVLAIALHNIPEGLAVGVAHASGATQGAAVTLGIAAQNLPEGLIVAWAMRTLGYSRSNSVLIALATGLMEPIGAL